MDKKGFTLIEILITIGLISLLAISIFVLDVNSFRGDSFRSEISMIGTAMQTARTSSMNNINQKRHGIKLYPNNQNKYVIFEGDNFTTRDMSRDINLDSSYRISISTTSPDEIVFDQLSGNANYDGDIVFIDDNRNFSLKIIINHEGKISW